jgi:uncharacterized Ntn-hydrolase superfamily protein
MRAAAWAAVILAVLPVGASLAAQGTLSESARQLTAPPVATFSIVARDSETGDLGVAVQSKYFAVGSVVPHARAGTGALATQARGNPLHGRDGLALLREGWSPARVIESLTAADPQRRERQIGIVDPQGRAASYTGEDCLPWAGGLTGPNYAVQGNVLAGPHVVEAMATAFENGSGDLATRMVRALAAGQAAGGDIRGRQSAAVLVVREGAGYLGLTDRHIDLHVEDHPTPIVELRRLLDIRLSHLALEEAGAQLSALDPSDPSAHAGRLQAARNHVETALRLNARDDHALWLLAQIHLSLGEPEAASAAARQALLINPSWRHLPPETRRALGVTDETIAALRETAAFRRLWHSLAPAQELAQ